ncbi:hypothetical protein KXD40_000722 [Peronospora effusa]|uniref:RxLR effector protein n=1 Tax=Peronospora effusa TaxID=542832 RepID=A0A3M6VS65_9STRA|nr:hypothetical protein DD238_002264 [Peronospora effusa]RQM11928.1 hypothetical protein DD237_003079 [Peronospora effusa]UIZ21430.1 hypothetical protein KXD40_000722 [Peronospora effusa]CAI5723800.1 unnamed protein product [Peronospora effusa]
MRVLNCVFLLAAFAAAVSADTTTQDKTTLNTVNPTDNTENNTKGSTADMTPSSKGVDGSTDVNGRAENTQDNDEFKIQPQPVRVPTEAPSTTPISPTPESNAGSTKDPSSKPDETIASSSAAVVTPTAFVLVSAVVYAML